MDTSWYQTIDIPLVQFNTEMLKAFIVSVRYSMRSIGTIGIIGLGVIISACLVVKYFNEHFFRKERIFKAVKNREFNREVNKADFDRNPNTIINDGLLKRTFQHHTSSLWDRSHRGDLVDDAVFRKGVNLDADIRFMSENKEKLINRRMMQSELSREARERDTAHNERYYKKRRKKG